MVGLREVLRMIEAEELANVFRRHDRLSRATRAGAEALGLRLFVKTTPSPALTAVEVPAGVDADRVVEGFATGHNITIDGGRGPTKGRIFRIGHMGYAACRRSSRCWPSWASPWISAPACAPRRRSSSRSRSPARVASSRLRVI
jgi:aspartate aminotransferase-like enzyme